MKNSLKLLLVFCLALSVAEAAPLRSPGTLFGGKRMDGWYMERPHAYSIRKLATPGESPVYRFEWRLDDWDGTRRAKGAELKTAPMPGLKEQWTRLQFYVSSNDFQDDSAFAIIMQYHSVPDFFLGEGWRNPVADLLIRNGELQYDFRASADRVTPGRDNSSWKYTSKNSMKLGRPVMNGWNTVILHQKFDYTDGFVRIWVNGKKYEMNPVGIGFNDWVGMFFKFGLYCPGKSDKPSKVIFFRNVHLYDETFPTEEAALETINKDLSPAK